VPDQVRVRRASTADVPVIARLAVDLGYQTDPATLVHRFRALPEGHAVLVAEVRAHVAGFVHVAVDPSLLVATRAQVAGIGVEPGWRGRGIGGRLLDEAATWAREHGAHHLWVRSGAERAEAHAFYLAHGFEDVTDQRVFRRSVEGAVDEAAPDLRVTVVPVIVPVGR
jgi:N-acetylglutamate synthase-like GNAT family acetyltransferase